MDELDRVPGGDDGSGFEASRMRALSRNRNFALLWGGEVLSELGSQLTTIAMPLLVLSLTGSAAKGLPFLTDAVSFLAAFLAILGLRLPQRPASASTVAVGVAGSLRDSRDRAVEGLLWLWNQAFCGRDRCSMRR